MRCTILITSRRAPSELIEFRSIQSQVIKTRNLQPVPPDFHLIQTIPGISDLTQVKSALKFKTR